MAITGVQCNIVIPFHCHPNRFTHDQVASRGYITYIRKQVFVGKSNRNRPFGKSWNKLDK